MSRTFVELYAGMAAVTWRLAGSNPPLKYQGGKRSYAIPILETMGLKTEDVDRVVLVEGDPVVADVLKAVFDEDLRAQVVEKVRGWIAPEDEQEAMWRAWAVEGREGWWNEPRSVVERAARWAWMRPRCAPMVQPHTASYGDWLKRPNGHGQLIPLKQVEALPSVPFNVEVVCAFASQIEPIPDSVAYLDPPYLGTKGYAVEGAVPPGIVARRWADAGAEVYLSEGFPYGPDFVDLAALKSSGPGRTHGKGGSKGEYLTRVR